MSSGFSKPLSYFVNEAVKEMNKNLVINFGVIESNHKLNLRTSVDKIKNHTKFTPKISFNEGIKKILKNHN